MAITYSSWEYSQGPNVYIDSSGFESIDDNKNFIYYYIVTYSPVEYKRKATDEKGVSTYEYKYSFGVDNSSRKSFGRFTFAGKEQMTKTVTHEVTEEGFKKGITKTFIIDTNIDSNIKDNAQIVIDPTYKISATNWTFVSSVSKPSIGVPYFGWITTKKSGYTTEYYWTTESYVTGSYTETETYTYYESVPYKCSECDDVHYHSKQKTGTRQVTRYTYGSRRVQRSRRVYYNYNVVISSYCCLSLKAIREKVSDYEKYSSVVFVLKTKNGLNKPPAVHMMTSINNANKVKLTPKSESSTSCNGLIEYYLPFTLINGTFKNSDQVYISVDKGSCSSADGYIIDAFAFVEIEADSMPYVNLVVQAYDAASDTWNNACVVPYLNYEEIEEMRTNKQHISKNLFFPSNLPKTDANYRIQLDTNLVANEAERFTNFRIDVLSDQLIVPGSIGDRTLFINNDSHDFENEVEVGPIDEIKLNVLGFTTHQKKPYAGFLKQGANDVHAYLKNSVKVIDSSVPETNITENVWYSYVYSTNGNWLSNNIFAANTFELGQIDILQGDSKNIQDDLIVFNIPYKSLLSNANYTLLFDAYTEESFTISEVNTVDIADKDKVIKTKLYVESNANTSKVEVQDYELVFYSPPYKLKNKDTSELVNEYNITERDISVRIEINTKDIQSTDTEILTLKIKRAALKNIILKDIQCICIDENNNKYADVFEPYNTDIYTGRQNDTFMTIYYDGFNLAHINPLLYNDMLYLKYELDKIREEYTLDPYSWSEWTNTYDSQGNLITDEEGLGYGVEVDQPLRAVHFNDVKQCCVQTYEELLALKPPVSLNTSPTQMREGINLIPLQDEDPSQGYVLQHYQDKLGNVMEVDKYFPEWRAIINLINRN